METQIEKPEEKAKKNTYAEYYCDYCGNKVSNQAFGGNKDNAFYCTPECASNANLGIEKPEETVPLSEKIKDSNMSADNKHPLLNQDSKHYSMVDDVEAIERMEQMYSSSDLMAWAKLSAMKYRLRIGSKDDVTKEAKKIETYEAYYSYLKTK